MVPRYLPRSLAAAVTIVVVAGLVTLTQAPALAACPSGPPSGRILTPASATGGSSVAGAKFGASLATGDFNKDGFADLAIGAPADKVGSAASGTVSVFRGSATGLAASGTRLSESNISGMANEAGDQFGASLAAGDFNKDGFADLAVGIPGETIGSTKSGMLAVFTGSASGPTTGKGVSQTLGGGANEAGDQFGASLAAGDLNGDGFAELAVGVPGEAPNGGTVHSGAVFVAKGSSSGIVNGWWADQADVPGAGNEAGDRFGAAVSIGNVTGDSHGDLVAGAPGEAPGSDPAGSGSIYVVPGAADGKGTGFARTQRSAGGSNEAGDNLGAAVAVGNLDGDGFADIVAGVPGEAPDSDPAGGAVTVYPGASATPTGFGVNERQAGQVVASGDKLGAAVGTGDVDGDGLADLLAGAPGRSSGAATRAGASYLFGGLPRKPDTVIDLNVGRPLGQSVVGETDEASDAFGAAVASGDFDHNGRAEVVVGASGEAPTGQPASGVVGVVSGLATCGSVAVEQFTRPSAMQAAPVPGASAGTVEYAYVDNIGRLLHGHQPVVEDFNSVQWTVISGNDAYSGQPALTQQPDARLQVLGRNVDTGMRTNTQATASPPAWGAWVNQGGLLASTVAVARQGDGKLVAFATDQGGVLWSVAQTQANGPYGVWRSLGDVDLVGTPAVVPLSGNAIQVFAVDAAGAVQTAVYNGGNLSAWTSLGGGGANGTPAVVVYPGFVLRVLVRGPDGTILTKKQDSTGAFPAAWQPIGTFTAAGSPSVLLDPASGRTELVAHGTDGAVWSTGETRQGSDVWRDWRNVSVIDPSTGLPEVAASDPTLFSVAGFNGPVLAFTFVREDNVVRVYQQIGTASGLSAQREPAGGPTAAPAFAAHSLPAPPR